MNPRIKELHLKAGFWASEQLPFTNPEWVELRDEKFAELIVQECAFQCQHLGDMERIGKHFEVDVFKQFGV